MTARKSATSSQRDVRARAKTSDGERRTRSATPSTRARDPEKTRARILAAATNEFASKGFDGARVDMIAKRAKTNKRMLYHYFGDKKALFEGIIATLLTEHEHDFADAPKDIEDMVVFQFNSCPSKSKWLRLMLWESLAYGDGPVMAERVRSEKMEQSRERMRKAQREGKISPALPPAHLLLAMMSMSVFPWAFPQITRMLTGSAPSEKGFKASYTGVLREVTRQLTRSRAARKERSPRPLPLS